MAALIIDHVTKVFDDDGEQIVAVDDVSIDIADGEFLVLVGPSGCGKSTTLRMVAGLETISDGTIRLGDELINGKRPQDLDIAMVFQSYALYPHMTVHGNMAFGLEESTDLDSDAIEERVVDAAEMMGIAALLDRKPGELSGGQQQRVALGRAIVRDPKAFLMDEPLANLDAKLRATMRTELQRLQEELGVTTIYVTHDQTEAMTMGDRIAVLDGGHLQQVGTPLELYHTPANRFVADFIGEPSMNFFETTVEGDRLVADEFEYELTDDLQAAVDGVPNVTLGIRPEDIELGGQADGANAYDVVVEVVEPMGDENSVHLSFSGEIESIEDAFVATVGGMRQFSEGDLIRARFPESAIHLFDAGTGETLHNRSLEDTEVTEVRL